MSSQDLARRPTVWLVNRSGHGGYHKAERFGRIVDLTSGNVNPFAVDRTAFHFNQLLGMAEKDDYLAISGLALLNMIAFGILMEKFDKVNVLQWARHKQDYVLLHITKEMVSSAATSNMEEV
jgi:hypothetical protein